MPEKFNVEYFQQKLQTSWLGSEFIYLEKTDSTNSYLKRVSSSDLIHGTVVLTDHQIKGRGQYERKWQAEPFRNLTLTIAFRPKKSDRLNLLTLAVAYSITKILKLYISEPVNIKWPNDILVGKKKIGGLLTECTFNGSNPDRMLIGLGLNIDQHQFSDGVGKSAVSFNKVSDVSITREDLLVDILIGIENIYQRWHKYDETLKQNISQCLLGYGKWVQVSINGKIPEQKFKFIGINSKGELLMLNEQLDVNNFTYEQVRILADSQRVSKSETDTSV